MASVSNFSEAKVVGVSEQLPRSYVKIGHIYKASHDDLQDRPNLDWALFAIQNKSFYLPNVIMRRDVRQISFASLTDSKRKVVWVTAASQSVSGILSESWSYIMLTPGKSLVRSYLLTLSDNKALQQGDSGDWVVDAETNEVYGHIVASDVFGRAYVVPIVDIFLDIRNRLSAQSVFVAFRYAISKSKFGYEMVNSNTGSINNQSTVRSEGTIVGGGFAPTIIDMPEVEYSPLVATDPFPSQTLEEFHPVWPDPTLPLASLNLSEPKERYLDPIPQAYEDPLFEPVYPQHPPEIDKAHSSAPQILAYYQDSKNNPSYPSWPRPAYPDSGYNSMEGTPVNFPPRPPPPPSSEGVIIEATEGFTSGRRSSLKENLWKWS